MGFRLRCVAERRRKHMIKFRAQRIQPKQPLANSAVGALGRFESSLLWCTEIGLFDCTCAACKMLTALNIPLNWEWQKKKGFDPHIMLLYMLYIVLCRLLASSHRMVQPNPNSNRLTPVASAESQDHNKNTSKRVVYEKITCGWVGWDACVVLQFLFPVMWVSKDTMFGATGPFVMPPHTQGWTTHYTALNTCQMHRHTRASYPRPTKAANPRPMPPRHNKGHRVGECPKADKASKGLPSSAGNKPAKPLSFKKA